MDLEWSTIIGLLIAGISRGMIYFLLAAGLTLIFGVLNVVNFAHGAFYMLGVFLSYGVISQGLNLGLAFLVVPLALALFGGLVEFILFRRIYRAEHAMQLLLSLGVIHMFSDIVRLIWGVNPVSVKMPRVLKGLFVLEGLRITKYNLFIIGVTLLVIILMYLILYKTKTGSIIRACTIDHEMTSCVGVNVSRVFLLVFMTGVGLAGIAAVTAAPVVTGVLGMDMQMIILAFCVVIIGGVGSIGGALIAALLIGIVESFGILILPGFAEAFVYIIVVVSLFIRPSGLFGKLVG
ncbi:MAG: branched-chain amino acid ABC transporter permease [Candidatus Tectomicrobia bacterium]|uniref:Branched-chain amino acid ABC transporter permease n=1 Tax=Tectimicrobiota bacterium TaxID=2528274 RepID=A0A933GKA2_UNCTE|nr:branched-chain amino acid ABC transporter permease [Candidatus Tectomicrobia bacterium]